MITQYIELGHNGWHIIIYYGVNSNGEQDIEDMLVKLGCPEQDIDKALQILTRRLNTGMTFTNTQQKTSFVCISDTTSAEQFVNTVVHEAKHVQSHICDYYEIEEHGETAAYMIGYIVQRMYKLLRLIRR